MVYVSLFSLYRQLKTGVGFRVLFQSGEGLLRRKGLKNADLAHQLALNVTALCDAMRCKVRGVTFLQKVTLNNWSEWLIERCRILGTVL